jgi:hypothetical protein
MGAAIRLRQEDAAVRQIVFVDRNMTGGRHYLDRRPAVSNEPGEFQPIHRSRHLDIGKDDVDIGTRFQDGDGRVGRLDDFEARAFDRLSGSSRSKNSSSTIKITWAERVITILRPCQAG